MEFKLSTVEAWHLLAQLRVIKPRLVRFEGIQAYLRLY